MKINSVRNYSMMLAGVTALSLGTLAIKKMHDHNMSERKQALEAVEYVKQYSPDTYESVSAEIDTMSMPDVHIIDKIWINTAKKLKDSLQIKEK